jgi:hypothetical protein
MAVCPFVNGYLLSVCDAQPYGRLVQEPFKVAALIKSSDPPGTNATESL